MLARTALIAAALAVSCGGTPAGYRARADRLGKAGDVEAAIQELRIGLAEHPRDGKAHAALARLQDRAGRPGAALRHFERAARLGELSRADRSRVAALHVERARARLALGDGDAWRDLADADVDVDDALWADAYRAGALAALRRSDDADSLLRKLAAIDPSDPRLAALDPGAADVATLGDAARWAWDGGARRAGHDLLAAYVDRGGRTPDLVRRWIEARLWWRGSEAQLSPEVMDTWIRGGGDACLAAYTPADYDCESLARPTAALWARANRLQWRTAHPHLAGVFVALALRQWATEGSDTGWLSLIVERVDVDALGEPDRWPLFAAPTLYRERMDLDEAARSLDDAVNAAADMEPHERAVVAAEVAIQGKSADVALAGPVPDYAWIAPAAAARAAGDSDLELARLEQAGPHVFRYLAGHGELARLVEHFGKAGQGARYRSAYERWADVMTPGAGADPAMPFGQPDPVAVAWAAGMRDRASIEGLAAVARAYRRDPSLAFRVAGDYVDEKVAPGERAPAVIELFIQLGEAAEAAKLADQLIETSPRHAPYLMLAGTAAAAAGDVERADVHFVAAAAVSGDSGATSFAAARVYARFGEDLAGIAAGRRALEVTPPGEEHEVLLFLAGAMLRLERRDAAEAALARYGERIAERSRHPTHRVRMLTLAKHKATLAATVRAQPTEVVLAEDVEDPSAVRARSAAWNSGYVPVRAKSGRVGELLAIALTADGDARAAALEALQRTDDRDLARAAKAAAAIR